MGQKEFLLKAQNALESAPTEMMSAGRPLRVLLIQPPLTDRVQSFVPTQNEEEQGIGHKPPQGILWVASTIKYMSPHDVKVIDAQPANMSYDDIVAEAVAYNPDIVGVSAWTDLWYPAYITGKRIKEALPDCHLSYGGPHLGIYPQETLDVPFIDSVIVGDGEVPFLNLCNLISNDVIDNSFPGLHFKDGGVKPYPNTLYVHGDLDGLPKPDRTMLPVKNYTSVMSRKTGYVTTMITSRGCPHQCTFCKLNFQKTLARSAESVVEEFREIAALGISEVEIYDDTFTWGRERLRKICEGLIEADLGVEWAIRDRVNKPDPELLALMYKAGCRRVNYGVESGAEHVLKRIKKRITPDEARQAVKLAKEAGLTVVTYFMFGNMDETMEDMQKTIDFALSINTDYAEFSVTIPYAGTEMYEEALREGIVDHDYWRDFAREPSPRFTPPQVIENNVTLEQMMAMRNKAIRQFYFRPKYLAREAFRQASLGEFLRKARMGARLLQYVLTKHAIPRATQSVYRN